MTAQPPIALIPYDHTKTVNFNVSKLMQHMNTTLKEFSHENDMTPSVLSKTVLLAFTSETGRKSKIGDKAKALLSPYFEGGIPDEVHREALPPKQDLFDLFGCAKCQFKMISEKGCYKFGLSKAEINKGAYITTTDQSAWSLSASKPCPHAIGRSK